MKAMVCLLAGALFLTGFNMKTEEDPMKGIWMGYYKADGIREKLVIKFCSEEKLEYYAGGMWEEEGCAGSYKILGDSISFNYKTPEGKEFKMTGIISQRKNYVDGTWMTSSTNGSFFIERQDVEEKIVRNARTTAETLSR